MTPPPEQSTDELTGELTVEQKPVAEILAEVAQDRDRLLERLHTADDERAPLPLARWRSQPWQVVRAYGSEPVRQVCGHRWEWVAELCAHRQLARQRHMVGVHYYTRPRAGS